MDRLNGGFQFRIAALASSRVKTVPGAAAAGVECRFFDTPRNVELSSLQRWPGPGLYGPSARTASAGRRAARVLISSYHNTSDLVMFHLISVKYAISLLLDSACDASAFRVAGQGLNQPVQRPLTGPWHCGPTGSLSAGPQACRLPLAHTSEQQAIVIRALHLALLQKKKLIYGHSINCRACCFKLKHLRIFS
jgi:hypothetical protein